MARKMSYEEFRDKIEEVLKKYPEGTTWTQIREDAELEQKWPNNKWVRRMDEDIGLTREKVKGQMTWRLGK